MILFLVFICGNYPYFRLKGRGIGPIKNLSQYVTGFLLCVGKHYRKKEGRSEWSSGRRCEVNHTNRACCSRASLGVFYLVLLSKNHLFLLFQKVLKICPRNWGTGRSAWSHDWVAVYMSLFTLLYRLQTNPWCLSVPLSAQRARSSWTSPKSFSTLKKPTWKDWTSWTR